MTELTSLIEGEGFRVKVFHLGNSLNAKDDNLDIQVYRDDNTEWVATIATFENLRRLMDGYRATGECAEGDYVFVADLILLREITLESIERTVADLIKSGEIEAAMSRVENSWLEEE